MDDAPDPKTWSAKALTAVFSLWDDGRNQAWRGSQEFEEMQTAGAKVHFRPTVTYNAVIAFGESGLFLDDFQYSATSFEIGPPQLRVEHPARRGTAVDVIRRLLSGKEWVDDALRSSEHGPSGSRKNNPFPRASIVLGRMVPAVSLLAG